MIVDISKDLKIVVGEERRVHGSHSQIRNTVPPPITEDVNVAETGRGLLIKMEP